MSRSEDPVPPRSEDAARADDALPDQGPPPGSGEALLPRNSDRPAPEDPETDRPSFLESLSVAFRCARTAWYPSYLFPVWTLCFLGWILWEGVLPALSRGSGPGDLILRLAAGLLSVLALWALSGIILSLMGWEFGRGERLGFGRGLRIFRVRWWSVFAAPLFAPGSGIAIVLALAVGCLFLSLVPVVGKVLSFLWLLIPGIPLVLIASGLVFLGIPALPLTLAAGAIEDPFPFGAASRGMSYVRARPAWYLGVLLGGLAGAVLGTFLFSLLASAFLVLLSLPFSAPELLSLGLGLRESLDLLGRELGGALASADPLWPFLTWPGPGGAREGASRVLSAVSVLAGRSVTAFFLAAVLSGVARTYLLIRWRVDGEPPGSQVLPGEEFRWSAGAEPPGPDR